MSGPVPQSASADDVTLRAGAGAGVTLAARQHSTSATHWSLRILLIDEVDALLTERATT